LFQTCANGRPILWIPLCAAVNSASVVEVLVHCWRLLKALIGKLECTPFIALVDPEVERRDSVHPA